MPARSHAKPGDRRRPEPGAPLGVTVHDGLARHTVHADCAGAGATTDAKADSPPGILIKQRRSDGERVDDDQSELRRCGAVMRQHVDAPAEMAPAILTEPHSATEQRTGA